MGFLEPHTLARIMGEVWQPRFHESRPLFTPLFRAMQAFVSYSDWPSPESYGAVATHTPLLSGSGQPLRFVASGKPRRRPRGVRPLSSLYEASVYLKGEVPTRERNWHDFFNMLSWATFPLAKARLNARQYAALLRRLPGAASEGVRHLGVRLREEDAYALCDEGALVLACPPAALNAVRDALARGLEGCRALGSGHIAPLRYAAFGHALYEAFLAGNTAVHGMALVVPCETQAFLGTRLAPATSELLPEMDAALAALIDTPSELIEPDAYATFPLTYLK